MRFTRSAPLTGGGTINGDLTITGDISVTGSSTVTSDEVLQGTSIIDVDSTTALVVRKNGAAGDVFIVATQNSRVGIGISPLATFHAKMASNVNFTTTANSSSLRLNAVNDAVDATISLEVNSTDTKFLSPITIDANATDGTDLTIDSEAQDGQGIYMDVSQQTTGYGINIADSGNSRTTGGLLYINSNQNNSGTRNVVDIINNHTGATNATALMVTQKAAVQAVKIDQDGNGDGLLISTDATTRHGLYVDGSAFTTGNGAYIYSNASNDSTRNLMLIVNDNTGATGATGLKIQQDSTAPAIVALGNVGIGTSSPSD